MLTTPAASSLQRFRCFQALGDSEVAAVAQVLRPIHLAPGQVLCRQGDSGESIYLLAAGKVEIRLDQPGQEEHVCTILEAGALFGEISPLLGEPRSATALAISAAEVWELPRVALEQALEHGERWAVRFLRATVQNLARRLIAMNEEVLALVADVRRARTPSVGGADDDFQGVCNRLFDEELLGLVRRSMV
jgi:CRP-like cAMP-binding protein